MPIFEKIGIVIRNDDQDDARRLVWRSQQLFEGEEVRFVLVRASDVPVYVKYGAADMGVSGLDVLSEQNSEGLYFSLNLQIAKCRLSLAAKENFDPLRLKMGSRLKVATKYPNITQRYFSSQGMHSDLIKLYGSMELAPMLGLADVIVDLVSSGNTLRSNGLREFEKIMDVSSYLITNPSASKIKKHAIGSLLQKIAANCPAVA